MVRGVHLGEMEGTVSGMVKVFGKRRMLTSQGARAEWNGVGAKGGSRLVPGRVHYRARTNVQTPIPAHATKCARVTRIEPWTERTVTRPPTGRTRKALFRAGGLIHVRTCASHAKHSRAESARQNTSALAVEQ